MWSVVASTTDANAVAHDLVYLAAHTPNANVDGFPEAVLDALGAACDAALAVTDYASPEDVTSALQPCLDAELADSVADGQTAGARLLTQALAEAQPP